jgi:hypothetical protein
MISIRAAAFLDGLQDIALRDSLDLDALDIERGFRFPVPLGLDDEARPITAANPGFARL